MEKRYQVFISSTFIDLIEERQAALKAVLEIDHMPAGMELFPASDESAWELIKEVIDSSDYYVLIIGGRYGSQDSEGISFTEKEYDYAVETGKPVIALLHKEPEKLPREKTEESGDAWQALKDFRAKVEKAHTCVYWQSPDELKAKVIVGLTTTVKKMPAVGWVRADQVPTGADISEILNLRNRLSELELEIAQSNVGPPEGSEGLLQGEDSFPLIVQFEATRPGEDIYDARGYQATIYPSWNEIFSSFSPTLIDEAKDIAVKRALKARLSKIASEHMERLESSENLSNFHDFKFDSHDLDTCMVQLRALGLIKESERKRSITDTNTYWTLTKYGDQLMVQLRALKKGDLEENDHMDQNLKSQETE